MEKVFLVFEVEIDFESGVVQYFRVGKDYSTFLEAEMETKKFRGISQFQKMFGYDEKIDLEIHKQILSGSRFIQNGRLYMIKPYSEGHENRELEIPI